MKPKFKIDSWFTVSNDDTSYLLGITELCSADDITRTTYIVGYDENTNSIETKNSIYILGEVAAGCTKEEMLADIPRLNCWCHVCNKDKIVNGFPFSSVQMILCPDCGNKRCPKANEHNNACTGSNEVGQAGSAYTRYENSYG